MRVYKSKLREFTSQSLKSIYYLSLCIRNHHFFILHKYFDFPIERILPNDMLKHTRRILPTVKRPARQYSTPKKGNNSVANFIRGVNKIR